MNMSLWHARVNWPALLAKDVAADVVTRPMSDRPESSPDPRRHAPNPVRRGLSYALLPFHLAALFGQAKSFRNNPVLGHPALNRAGLHLARVSAAAKLA